MGCGGGGGHLCGPGVECGPGDEDEVKDEDELERQVGHRGDLQLELLVTHSLCNEARAIL